MLIVKKNDKFFRKRDVFPCRGRASQKIDERGFRNRFLLDLTSINEK